MKKRGFTLIELLTVIAIIGVLAGFLLVAVAKARERGRITKAVAETRELAKAWRTYWIVYGDTLGWPTAEIPDGLMDGDAMKILMADDDSLNPQRIVFMDADADAVVHGFLDPWGRQYKVDFSSKTISGREYYETTIAFPNRERYYHE